VILTRCCRLSDDERPKSSKSVEVLSSSVDDDLRARLVAYFVKHNVGTSVMEAEKKLADPTLLDRLKVYYDKYQKSGDLFSRRLSEGDALLRNSATEATAAAASTTVQSADRPTLERRPVRTQPYDFHSSRLNTNGSSSGMTRRKSSESNGIVEQQKRPHKDLEKMENFIAQLKRKADK
jgi:hypothetical protein